MDLPGIGKMVTDIFNFFKNLPWGEKKRSYSNKRIHKYVAPFFSPLSRGYCTFYEEASGAGTVFMPYLNIKNLDLQKLKTISCPCSPGIAIQSNYRYHDFKGFAKS